MKPTAKQTEAIKKMGLSVPPTKTACSNLIKYILYGNATFGDDADKRIAIAKNYEEKWVGKKVRINRGMIRKEEGTEGIVRWMSVRTPYEVRCLGVDGVSHPHPFRAMVHFPSTRKTHLRSLSELDLLLTP
ncbi:MAG: hypothetical protein HY506_01020 [Candidatus Yanofskybacteria bacterium]|nr:hypothetical protein [Candidatus Yanofskybacteria bacterium]